MLENLAKVTFVLMGCLTALKAEHTTMVNCAACMHVNYAVTSWECGVTCDTITDEGKGINITTLYHELQELKTQVQEMQDDTKYAFSAHLSATTVANDDPVVFDAVELNVGGGYNVNTGIFTAPVSGTYFIAMFGFGGQNGDIYMKQNSDNICRTWHTTSFNDHATCSTVANVTAGDFIFVCGSSANPSEFRGRYSGFNAHLIQKN